MKKVLSRWNFSSFAFKHLYLICERWMESFTKSVLHRVLSLSVKTFCSHHILIWSECHGWAGMFFLFIKNSPDEGRQMSWRWWWTRRRRNFLRNHKIVRPSKFPHQWVLILINAWFGRMGPAWRLCHQPPYGSEIFSRCVVLQMRAHHEGQLCLIRWQSRSPTHR